MNRKIIKYTTVFRCVASTGKSDFDGFDREVNSLIEKGYQPYGSLKIVQNSSQIASSLHFTQVMVKYE